MKNILFIHGFAGGTYEFKPIQKFIKKEFNELVQFFEFTYKEKFGQTKLNLVAEQLKNFVESNLQDKNFYVIAISQGGIIWRIFTQQDKQIAQRVEKVITICTPHKGSWLAYPLAIFLPGIADLKPKSQLLNELSQQKENIKYYSVYNPLDLMVFPGTNAIFDQAIINKKIWDIGHMFTFWNKKTLKFISDILE